MKNKVVSWFFGKRLFKTKEEKIMAGKALVRDITDMDEPSAIKMSESWGQQVGKLYDFYQNWGGHDMDGFSASTVPTNPAEKPIDDRKIATPISVMQELETVPIPFTLENLDEKIETLKDKTKLTNQHYAKEQIQGLIERLEYRKKYIENEEFYSRFPNTTDGKIDNLLSTYKLVMKTSDLFVPTFPKEAIDIMKEYEKVTKEITGKSVIFYVIAEAVDFKKKEVKLDPILLAQSPFGFFWQILGVWGEEMLILSEL